MTFVQHNQIIPVALCRLKTGRERNGHIIVLQIQMNHELFYIIRKEDVVEIKITFFISILSEVCLNEYVGLKMIFN